MTAPRFMKKIAAALAVTAVFALFITASAQETDYKLQFFFAPHIMNDVTGELVVDVDMKNYDIAVPKTNGAMAGVTFAFEYSGEAFDLMTNEDGSAMFITDENTLISSMNDAETSVDGCRVSFTFLDSTLSDALISRDGTLVRFKLKAKNPRALWNSFDKYPIRFTEGSIGVVTYHMPSYSVGTFGNIEGIDAMAGGYNEYPSLISGPIGKKLEFRAGSAEVIVDGTAAAMDAAPFIKEERLMLPVRYLAENIGMTVEWDGDVMVASAYGEYKTLKVHMKDWSVYLNSAKQSLSVTPEEINGRIYVPADIASVLYPNSEVTSDGEGVVITFK